MPPDPLVTAMRQRIEDRGMSPAEARVALALADSHGAVARLLGDSEGEARELLLRACALNIAVLADPDTRALVEMLAAEGRDA